MKKPVILCVDDEKIILDSLEEQINARLGEEFDVEVAESGEEGLEIIEELEEEGRELAVVISDQLMPGMKGADFLIKVHERNKDALKILLTGQASLDAVQKAINGARLYRYVNKPWEENDLMLTIQEAAYSFIQKRRLEQYTKEIQEYNRLLAALNSAIQDLSSEIAYDKTVRKIMNHVIQIFKPEYAYLIVQGSNGQLQVRGVGAKEKTAQETLMQRMQNDLNAFTKEIIQKIMNLLHGAQVNYQMVVPLSKQNKILGYLFIENPEQKTAFNPKQKESLQMLAAQAAISLDNALLYEQLRNEKERIEQLLKELAQKNQDLQESIYYARRIQRAILPDPRTLQVYYEDSFIFYREKDIVSGDFYWIAEAGTKLYLAAVDCTGHGVPGAFMAVMGSNFLSQILQRLQVDDPGMLLDILDKWVKDTLRQSSDSEVADGMDVALCIVDMETHELAFAGAFRPFWYFRNGELHEIRGTRRPIGGAGKYYKEGEEPPFEVFRLQLQKGDTFYLFSDGFIDQFGGPEGKKFSKRRFKELLIAIHKEPMERQRALIEEAFEKWKGDNEQTDDVMVIGVRV